MTQLLLPPLAERGAFQTSRRIQAAVVRRPGGPFEIEALELEEPRPDEVRVRIVGTGMCHTDLVVRDGHFPAPLPIVLGHEGAGVVECIGANVTKVSPGDHVVLTYMSCGCCNPCLHGAPSYCHHNIALCLGGGRPDGTTATHKGQDVVHDHFFGQSSFATYAIANERNVIKVPEEAPLELLGPLGCGIQTGAGAVMNALKIPAGAAVAVFGAGAVGLSAVMAAHIVGASTIIAVDVVPSRLDLALEIGATHMVNSAEQDSVTTIREITGGGVEYSLEAAGQPGTVRQAVDALGGRGTCGVLGIAPPGTVACLDVNGLMMTGKTIRGIVEGDSVPDTFIPQLIDLHLQGRFPFDKLVRFYPLEEINQAAEDSERGITVKPIICCGR